MVTQSEKAIKTDVHQPARAKPTEHLLRLRKGLWAKVHWHVNRWMLRHLSVLDRVRGTVTVIDAFGAPGDTLLTAIVCRHIRTKFPNIQINCITPNAELLRHDPNVDSVNAPEGMFSVRSWYLGLLSSRSPTTHVLQETFDCLAMPDYEYRAEVFLTPQEREWGAENCRDFKRPLVAINSLSKEAVKNWPAPAWAELVRRLEGKCTILHLGDNREPAMAGNHLRRFAGRLSLRESLAVLAQADLHIGPDSFLMHAANGLGVQSVIIFGGSRTPANLGYPYNDNLATTPSCGSCWYHDSRGDICPFGISCMTDISVDEVYVRVMSRIAQMERVSSENV